MCVCVYLLRACAHLIPKSTVDRAHTVPHSRGATATEKCKNVAMCVCERERESSAHTGAEADKMRRRRRSIHKTNQLRLCFVLLKSPAES